MRNIMSVEEFMSYLFSENVQRREVLNGYSTIWKLFDLLQVKNNASYYVAGMCQERQMFVP